MKVIARHSLIRDGAGIDADALLLEGAWPRDARGDRRYSLDESIDARFQWIDSEAARLAQSAAGGCDVASAESILANPGHTLAFLNALKLRYWFVKMLRIVAFFECVAPLGQLGRIELYLQQGRDDDYASLLRQLCESAATPLVIRWCGHPTSETPPAAQGGPLRRWAGRLESRTARERITDSDGRPRVVLCGNPALLDPVCRELVKRGSRVGWLYEQFAFRAFARWRPRGVRQLLCDTDGGAANRFAEMRPLAGLQSRGVDLNPATSSFLADCGRRLGARQTSLLAALEEHFSRFRPQALVLDEDATPRARAAVLMARRHGVATAVVQHGAPCVRFGFAPLAADCFFAWGETSERQLIRWGVPARRIRITGSPKHERLLESFDARRSRRRRRGSAKRPLILVLDNVLPRDDRPDSVCFRLTRTTHTEMLRIICATIRRVEGARLAVKLHPRSPNDSAWREVLWEIPHMRALLIYRGDFLHWARRADCVLSCASSAGIESAVAGIPVVQLLPAGSGNVLPAEDWGLLGTARSESELAPLLRRALSIERRAECAQLARILGSRQRPAHEQIADALLDDCGWLDSAKAIASPVPVSLSSGTTTPAPVEEPSVTAGHRL